MIKRFQMIFKMLKVIYLSLNIRDMLLDKFIYPVATDGWIITKSKQGSNFRKTHTMLSAMTNKPQTCNIIFSIETIIPFRPLWGFQQSLFFIIANGDDLTSGHLCQFSNLDFHAASLGSLWHRKK